MPYTKTNWVAGDTVTSEKLNKIENQLESLSESTSGGNSSNALSPYDMLINIIITRDTSTTPIAYSATVDKTNSELQEALSSSLLIGGKLTENWNNGYSYPITYVGKLLGNPALGSFTTISAGCISFEATYYSTTQTTENSTRTKGYRVTWNVSTNVWDVAPFNGVIKYDQ